MTLHLVEPRPGPRGLVLEFTLPFPPTVNNLFFTAGRARHLSRAGRSYVKRVGELALVNALAMPRFVLGCHLGIYLRAWPPDNKARDLDNLLKAPLDALKKCGVLRDDADIDDVRIVREAVVPGGRLVVKLWQL